MFFRCGSVIADWTASATTQPSGRSPLQRRPSLYESRLQTPTPDAGPPVGACPFAPPDNPANQGNPEGNGHQRHSQAHRRGPQDKGRPSDEWGQRHACDGAESFRVGNELRQRGAQCIVQRDKSAPSDVGEKVIIPKLPEKLDLRDQRRAEGRRGDKTITTSATSARPPPPPPVGATLRRTETVLASRFTTTRSGLPSPLRSATATATGARPVGKSVDAPKLPVPVPRRTETVLASRFTTTRSGLPSPLRSATATATGARPVGKSVDAPKLPVPVRGERRQCWRHDSRRRGPASRPH